MTTNNDFIAVEETEYPAPSRARTHRMVTFGAAAMVAVVVLSAVVQKSGDEPAQPATRTVVPMTMDQKLQGLADKGLIPRQAVEAAPMTMDQKLQDLVDRGLIPRQALEPAPLTMDEKLRDLVNRGLIPRQTLEEAPDSGIPCSEPVYTRC